MSAWRADRQEDPQQHRLTWRDRLRWSYLKHFVMQTAVGVTTYFVLYELTHWWLPDLIHQGTCALIFGC